MSHSTACLTCLFNKLMGVGDCRGAWNHSKVSRCIPTRIVGCIVWSYPHKPRIAGKFLRPPGQWTSISQVLFDPGLTYVDMRSLPRAVGCWRQAPRSHPPFVFLLPCGQELARSWKHPHGLPPPSVHDTFSDSAQIQPHPKQIPNPKYKIKKNLTYPEGKRERETYLQGTSQLCQSHLPMSSASSSSDEDGSDAEASASNSQAEGVEDKAPEKGDPTASECVWGHLAHILPHHERQRLERETVERAKEEEAETGLDENLMHFQLKS